jgi:hypothetical protein
MAVSGWLSSCATLDAISPMVIRRLADCARSACAAPAPRHGGAGDVGGNHHLRQAAVHPVQVARAHLQPLAQLGDKDLGVARLASRSAWSVGRPTNESTFVQRLVVGGARRARRPAPPAADGPAVCVPNHRRYSLLANSSSSLPSGATETDASSASSTVVKRSWRGRQLVADAVGLGDVGHRGHPAGLLAHGVDQRRHVHARVEQRAVLALDRT